MDVSGWVKCPWGCGISHREGDAAPVHNAEWASDAIRAIVKQAGDRGIVLMLSEDTSAAPDEVVN